MKKIVLIISILFAGAASAQTTKALIGKDTLPLRADVNTNTAQTIANAAAIQQRADSARNNNGVFELRKGGVFKPQFVLPAGGSGVVSDTITNGPFVTITTNPVQTWATWQPSNYGTVYNDALAGTRRMDRWYEGYATFTNVNSSSRPNNVWYHGYNATPEGGRVNFGDAGFQFRHETHYDIPWGDGPAFEFHIPEISRTDGTMQRLFSIYASKTTGRAFINSAVSEHKWYNKDASDPYATISDIGGTSLLLQKLDTTNDVVSVSLVGKQAGTIRLINAGSLSYLEATPIAGQTTDFDFRNVKRLNLKDKGTLKLDGSILIGSTADVFDAVPNAATHSSALLELRGKHGFLTARVATTERDTISNPANGLLIYNTDSSKFQFYNGSAWATLGGSSGGGGSTASVIANEKLFAKGSSNTGLAGIGTIVDYSAIANVGRIGVYDYTNGIGGDLQVNPYGNTYIGNVSGGTGLLNVGGNVDFLNTEQVRQNSGGNTFYNYARGGTNKFATGYNTTGFFQIYNWSLGRAVYISEATNNFTIKGSSDDGVNALQVNGSISEVVPEYADNAAALAAGKPIGTHYRTGDLLKIVH